MSLDPRPFAERLSAEIGLEFTGAEGRDGDGSRWLELCPAGHPVGQTFTLRTVVGWRRIDVYFKPGNFAGELIEAMRQADEAGRKTFRVMLGDCRNNGAEVLLTINGNLADPESDAVWEAPWRTIDLAVRRGMLAINEGDANSDRSQIEFWSSRAAAAVLALLPLEYDDEPDPQAAGLPEGAKVRVEANRYERDRRNRAAALAIHGYSCLACDVDMGRFYGEAAAGLIEVHHVVPVSEVGPGYIIDVEKDLVPLCPNCHAVAHRRSPPFTAQELRAMRQAAPAPD